MSGAVRNLALVVLVGIGLVACARTVRLPTIPWEGGGCRGVALDGILRGDPADPRVAWVESHDPRGVTFRQDVVFPAGYSARFTPSLEVLDSQGRAVARAGDPITGGCVTGPDGRGPLLILRPGFK